MGFGVLTSKCFRSRHTSSGMRAHETVHVDIVLPKLIQEALCKSTLSVVAIDYQLGNPTHRFVVDFPTAGECVTSKLAINSDSDVRACGIIGQALGSKPVFTETYTTSCAWLVDERKVQLRQLTWFCEFPSRTLAPNTVVFTKKRRGFL